MASNTTTPFLTFFLVLIYFFAVYYVYRKIHPHFSGPVAQLVVIFELTMMVYAAFNANRMGILGLSYCITPQMVISEHMRLLGEQLAEAMRPWVASWSRKRKWMGRRRRSSKCFQPRGGRPAVLHLCGVIAHFRAEHTATMAHLMHLNRNVGSSFLGAAALSQLPINLWMVSSLLFKRQSRGEQGVMVALILIQLYLGAAARSVLVKLSSALYSPPTLRLLVRAQVQALVVSHTVLHKAVQLRQIFRTNLEHGSLVRAKLKLATYYELLNTNEQFCFTMGPLGRLSKRGIFEVMER